MATATIKLEFNLGNSIEEAFEEAIRLATTLRVWCEFDFNGVTCLANAESEIAKGVESYHNQLERKIGHKMAFA